MLDRLNTDFADEAISESFEIWVRETVRGRIQLAVLLSIGIFAFALVLELALANEQVRAVHGTSWLIGQISIGIVSWVVMHKLPWSHRYPVFVATPLLCLQAIVGGLYLSSMGGFDGPFYYAVYFATPLVAFLPCALLPRLVISISMVVCFTIAFLGPHPEYLRYSLLHIPVMYVVAGSAVSIALGHFAYKLTGEHYIMGQLLSRENETLSERVEENIGIVSTLIQRLDATRKAERTQIARMLHDELGQLIVGARMKISKLERKSHRNGQARSSSELTGDLTSLAELMDVLNRSSRDLLSELRTKEDDNLEQRIKALVQSFAEHMGLEASICCQLPRRLPPIISETVYRITQEALTNVVKHAGPCDVEVRIEVREGGEGASEVIVSVKDTGLGFETTGLQEGESLGLIGMRERVGEAEGTLSIASSASGTLILARLPLPKNRSVT